MNMDIRTSNNGSYLDLVADIRAVTRPRALEIFRHLTASVQSTGIRKALVEVVAPGSELRFLDHVAIWNFVLESELSPTRIAYVVTGRNIDAATLFAETYANGRGLNLQFFATRPGALAWLLSDLEIPLLPARVPAVHDGSKLALASSR